MRLVLVALIVLFLVFFVGLVISVTGIVKYSTDGLVIVGTRYVHVDSGQLKNWLVLFSKFQTNKQFKILVFKDAKPIRQEMVVTQSLTDDNFSDVTLLCDWKTTLLGGRARILRIDFDRSRYVENKESKEKFNSAAVYCLGKLFNLDSDQESKSKFEQQFMDRLNDSNEQAFIL